MSDKLGKFFGPFLRPYEMTESFKVADWAPAVDIQETEKDYLLKLEIPEVKKEDVKVMLQDNELTVTGERKLEKEEKGKKFTASSAPMGRSCGHSPSPPTPTRPRFMQSSRTGCFC